jgi:type I restriction enzyme R subunit
METASAAHFARATPLSDAADRLMAPESVRRDFLSKPSLLNALYRAVKPDPAAMEFATRCVCLSG